MNSLYAPADSLKPILHTVIRKGTELEGSCSSCGLTIQFNKYSRRWESNEWNGIYCKKAGK